jgi:hypothetical protein
MLVTCTWPARIYSSQWRIIPSNRRGAEFFITVSPVFPHQRLHIHYFLLRSRVSEGKTSSLSLGNWNIAEGCVAYQTKLLVPNAKTPAHIISRSRGGYKRSNGCQWLAIYRGLYVHRNLPCSLLSFGWLIYFYRADYWWGMEGGEGPATINLSLSEGPQNGRSAVCVLTTNQMTLNTTIRAKNLTFWKLFSHCLVSPSLSN